MWFVAAALAADGSPEPAEDKHPVRFVLLYLPNRVLDLVDIVRLRARIGPGVAIGVRATEWADAYVGLYGTAYVGLPGPRSRRLPKLPFGIESQIGAEVSKADLATGLWLFDPDYGQTEFGLDVQALVVGGAVGVDPGEAWDFLAGLVGADPRDDDLGTPREDRDR